MAIGLSFGIALLWFSVTVFLPFVFQQITRNLPAWTKIDPVVPKIILYGKASISNALLVFE